MFTASGLLVRFLKVFEKNNYHSIKWVRYLTKANGGYQIRVSRDQTADETRLTYSSVLINFALYNFCTTYVDLNIHTFLMITRKDSPAYGCQKKINQKF